MEGACGVLDCDTMMYGDIRIELEFAEAGETLEALLIPLLAQAEVGGDRHGQDAAGFGAQ